MLLVLSNKEKGMQSSSEQPLVGEERLGIYRLYASIIFGIIRANWHISASSNASIICAF